MALTDLLYRLQELEAQEERLKKRKGALVDDPEYLAEKDALAALAAELEEGKAQLAAFVREQHRLEMDLKQTNSRREDVRTRIYDGSVTNMKELEKMTHMVEELDASRERVEDRILELMGLAEELEALIRERENALQEETARFQEAEQNRLADLENLERQLAEFPADKDKVLAEIAPELMQHYRSVQKRMGSQPLSRVEKQVCAGCRVSVSAAVMREIKKGDRLVQCESCGRILHWEVE